MRPDRKEMEALLQRLVKAVGDCEDTEAVLRISRDAESLLRGNKKDPVYPDIVTNHFVYVRECLDLIEASKTPSKTVYSMPCVKFEFKAIYGGNDKRLKRIISA